MIWAAPPRRQSEADADQRLQCHWLRNWTVTLPGIEHVPQEGRINDTGTPIAECG